MSKKQKKWSYSTGERPHTVTVEEREPGGVIYGRVWDPNARAGRGNWIRRSLKHSDRERAKVWAKSQVAKLVNGEESIRAGKMTLAQVLAAYLKHRTPRKTERERKSDTRRVEMWTCILGGTRDPHTVSLGEWERFIDRRSSGAIDPRGNEVATEKRRSVRARSVEADCNWLRWVFNWAVKWRTPQGHYLMRENPVRGFEAPREKNPRRPVATQDRYEALRKVSDQVMMETRWGKAVERRSYLSELLDIANGTGRRLSAICKLRYEDLRPNEGPYGAIRWPADTDKMGRESVIPVSKTVSEALQRILRERPGIGSAPLFPSPEKAHDAISRHLAHKWLRKGEQLAKLEPLRGSLWHAFRRKWATERKHMPDVDVAAAGGWANTVSLKACYQQADGETMLRVVLEPAELREAK